MATIANALSIIRNQLRDTSDVVANRRWADADLIMYLDAGQRQMFLDFRHTLCGDSILLDAPDALPTDDDTTVLDIADEYLNALAHFAVWMVLSEDADDEHNMRLAGNHYQLFLKGVAA